MLFVNIITMVYWEIIPRAEASVATLVQSINKVIINPIIFLLFALAAVYFLYGLAQYLLSPNNEEVRKKSKSVMFWGLIGLFIMVAVFGIMRLILGTFKVNNIKINNNGDYVVEDVNSTAKDIADQNIKDNVKSNQDPFNNPTDISIQDTIQLDPKEFITDPFPEYSVDSLCWHEPMHDKASTELGATTLVKSNARKAFLQAIGLSNKDDKILTSTTLKGDALKKFLTDNGITDEDLKNYKYPTIFDTKVLYDKANKEYHAWVDARGPKNGGTDKSCNLKVLKKARVIADGVEQVSVSNNTTIPDNIDPKVFTTSPFAYYEEKKDECWRYPLYATGTTEFEATQKVKSGARAKFLKETSILDTEEKNKNYPIAFSSKILYSQQNKTYYSWIDARAPLNGKTITACNLKALAPAPKIPDGAQPIDVSAQNTEYLPRDTFTKSPFATYQEDDKFCWHRQLPFKSSTEYEGTDAAKIEVKKQYLNDNKDIPTTDDKYKKYPVIFDSKILYDSLEKVYYTWVDVRGPTLNGNEKSCNLAVIKEAPVIPDGATPIDLRASTDSKITTVSTQRIASYTTSPFTNIYLQNLRCWQRELPSKADTEYQARQGIKKIVRDAYIKDNKLDEATAEPRLPIMYAELATYDAKNKLYYIWWDVRAPIKGGADKDCNLKVIGKKSGPLIMTDASNKADPFGNNYVSDNNYYRVHESAVGPIYADVRYSAINNALLQLASLKGLSSTLGMAYKILDEMYYPKDVNTGNYDYWVAVESKK